MSAIALPVAALLVFGWQRLWMADDAYIDLRVVHNVLGGYGPVFNVGERVEAYTNPLWVGILTLWGWSGLSLPYGAVILGLFFSAVGLFAAEAASAQLWRASTVYRQTNSADPTSTGDEVGQLPSCTACAPTSGSKIATSVGAHAVRPHLTNGSLGWRTILLPIGAIAFIAVPAVWDFTTSGLETGLTFGWLGVTFWLLVTVFSNSDLGTNLRGVTRPEGSVSPGPQARASATEQDPKWSQRPYAFVSVIQSGMRQRRMESKDLPYLNRSGSESTARDPSTARRLRRRSAQDDRATDSADSYSSGATSKGTWLYFLTAFTIGLGPLIRPDLALWSGCFLIVLLWGYVVSRRTRFSRAWPELFVIGATAVALPLAYELFRMAYFAALLPNTAYAKDAGGAYWSQGLTYLWDFVDTYAIFFPFILLIGLAAAPIGRIARGEKIGRLQAAVWLSPIAGGLLDTLYVVRVGGDFMHARFLLPAFFGSLMPVMLVPITLPRIRFKRPQLAARNALGIGSAISAALVIVWAIGCAAWLRPAYGASPAADGISNERAFYADAAGNSHPITPADYARLPFAQDGVWIHSLVEVQLSRQRRASAGNPVSTGNSPSGMVLINGVDPKLVVMSSKIPSGIVLVAVRSALGLVSYIAGSRAFIVDRFGLADPIGSRLDVKERGRPGHEKDLSNAWALARFADPGSPAAQSSEVKAAKAALACGAPHRLLQAIEQPLSLRRMLDNIEVAVQLHNLTIPEVPQRAEAKFCRSS